jgi:excinuclease ABC subunit C
MQFMSRRDRSALPSLFDATTFAGFGPSRFRPVGEEPISQRIRRGTPGEKRLWQKVRDFAPKRPGVYGMLDRNGRVIYIGKAKALRQRLLSYFRTNSRDPKAGKILSHTNTLCWEECADEFAALLRELELIRRFRPRFNVLGQPGPRRYVYLCLGKRPAPYAYLSRQPDGKEVAVYGPLVGRGRADDAVRRLNDYFALRDCPTTDHSVRFRGQIELFSEPLAPRCLRSDIGNCLAPCAAYCSQEEYAAKVKLARAFLDGRDLTPITTLTQQMTEAATQLRFEQAMSLRDRLQSMQWLTDRLAFLRGARRGQSFVYPLRILDGRAVWYLIHHGEVQAAIREPWTSEELVSAESLIRRTFAQPRSTETIDSQCVDSVLLVTSWFRKYRDEKQRLLTERSAVELCQEKARKILEKLAVAPVA